MISILTQRWLQLLQLSENPFRKDLCLTSDSPRASLKKSLVDVSISCDYRSGGGVVNTVADSTYLHVTSY
jgi:hypothetical protein